MRFRFFSKAVNQELASRLLRDAEAEGERRRAERNAVLLNRSNRQTSDSYAKLGRVDSDSIKRSGVQMVATVFELMEREHVKPKHRHVRAIQDQVQREIDIRIGRDRRIFAREIPAALQDASMNLMAPFNGQMADVGKAVRREVEIRAGELLARRRSEGRDRRSKWIDRIGGAVVGTIIGAGGTVGVQILNRWMAANGPSQPPASALVATSRSTTASAP